MTAILRWPIQGTAGGYGASLSSPVIACSGVISPTAGFICSAGIGDQVEYISTSSEVSMLEKLGDWFITVLFWPFRWAMDQAKGKDTEEIQDEDDAVKEYEERRGL